MTDEPIEGVVYGDLWIVSTPFDIYPWWVCRTGVGKFKPFMSKPEAEHYMESYPDDFNTHPDDFRPSDAGR